MNYALSTDKPVTRILGIDPGSRVTGFGVVEQSGNHLIYVTSGCIRTSAKSSLSARLGVIFAGLKQIIATEQPDEAAIEQVFVSINPQSTLLLGQARGAAICALVAAELPVSEYTALQIKQAVVGQGRATKRQVQHMVRRLLNLPGDPSPDAADALACAICHIHSDQCYGKPSSTAYRMRGGRLLI